MASDYDVIKSDNEREYGVGVGRWARDLLADRYDDRTHFIYELLQNAEDAIARRTARRGSRSVKFHLTDTEMRVSHFGKPFDEPDVRGICGIAESTKKSKDLTAIGRFGIGFKSVYQFTDRPQVHSGDEDFVIENYVWPAAAPKVTREAAETVFILPLKKSDATAHDEIVNGLRKLGSRTLLFLRQITEIEWSVDGGPSGTYLRDRPIDFAKNTRRVFLMGQEEDQPDIEESWLVFSREARTKNGNLAGYVEIAYALEKLKDRKRWSVQPITDSPLVAFFPTILETHLGFLVQGPYRTTPSRDNVPRNDPWNQQLIKETATLLINSLHILRDKGLLDTAALSCLPLDRNSFPSDGMFAPVFDAVKRAIESKPLLPAFGRGYLPGNRAKIARTNELRELIDEKQLKSLFGTRQTLSWLHSDITQDRTPEIRQYLLTEQNIPEVTPDLFLSKLSKVFLEAQSDDWVVKLYQFLNGQPALARQGKLDDVPLIRLDNGKHVRAKIAGVPQAFLPSASGSGFPTVRRSVCTTKDAKAFLQSLGLTEPDPVDDVIRNVLAKYRSKEIGVGAKTYAADIGRIVQAYGTDSMGQREKLIDALRGTTFVLSIDAHDGKRYYAIPGRVYLATQNLKELFAAVPRVLLVDDTVDCLRGEAVRDLLVAVGASRYLRPVHTETDWHQQNELRARAGASGTRSAETFDNKSIAGLDELLSVLATLKPAAARERTALLWDALADLEQRQKTAFTGRYSGTYYNQPKTCDFDPVFVERLNATAWVPDADGKLQKPDFVVFDNLGWKSNPFLLSKIHFKPPIIETLAKEAGIDPAVLDLLKTLGLTSLAEFKTKLGIKDDPKPPGAPPDTGSVDDALKKLLGGGAPDPTPPVPDPSANDPSGAGGSGASGGGRGTGHGGTGAAGGSGGASGGAGTGGAGPHKGTGAGPSAGGGVKATGSGAGGHKRTPGSTGGRPFISYVGAQPDDEEPDPDGLDHEKRITLEEKAIVLILSQESGLKRTETNNPGFDLFESGAGRSPMRWVEVKAMTGDLHSRPVGMSHRQFECAQEHGEAYWLYVVEYADSPDEARIVRIQDPAGKARTFTFDHGWLSVAKIDEPGDAELQAQSEEE